MALTRRGFLKYLAVGAAGVLVPELIARERTYFLPPAGGWNSGLHFADWRPAPNARVFLEVGGTLRCGTARWLPRTPSTTNRSPRIGHAFLSLLG
jgi:hypothetical protein